MIYILIAFICGFIAHRQGLFRHQLRKLGRLRRSKVDLSDRFEVSREEALGGKVILIFGQSNSANHGEACYASTEPIYNFYEGKFYKAKDPLLGATGTGGSLGLPLAESLIHKGLTNKVLLITIGEGDEIKHWVRNKKLGRTLRQLKGIKIDYILWHQGESDAQKNTPPEEYKQMFLEIIDSIRTKNIDAPIFVAVATRVANKINTFIQDAQQQLTMYRGVYPGPNTDILDSMDDRRDKCHFSEIGQLKHADLWVEAIIEYMIK